MCSPPLRKIGKKYKIQMQVCVGISTHNKNLIEIRKTFVREIFQIERMLCGGGGSVLTFTVFCLASVYT